MSKILMSNRKRSCYRSKLARPHDNEAINIELNEVEQCLIEERPLSLNKIDMGYQLQMLCRQRGPSYFAHIITLFATFIPFDLNDFFEI